MKQHYIDERTGISYTLQGNYYLPNFILPVKENKFIGIWGRGGKGTHLLSATIILIAIFIIKKCLPINSISFLIVNLNIVSFFHMNQPYYYHRY